jgi:hypothetical protein
MPWTALTTDSDRFKVWGFTEISETCACGATRRRRLSGKHDAQDPLVNELERLSKL